MLLVSPIMHNIREGEEEKEDKTIHAQDRRVHEQGAGTAKPPGGADQRIGGAAQGRRCWTRTASTARWSATRSGAKPLAAPAAMAVTPTTPCCSRKACARYFPSSVSSSRCWSRARVTRFRTDDGESGGGGGDRRTGASCPRRSGLSTSKYAHLMMDDHGPADEETPPAPAGSKISPRSVQRLSKSIENLSIFLRSAQGRGLREADPGDAPRPDRDERARRLLLYPRHSQKSRPRKKWKPPSC